MLFRFLLFFLFSISVPAWADELIIEPEMGKEPIINAIQSAQYSVDLVMYGFTEPSLLNALIAQKMKGRTVNIILENHPYKAEGENNKIIAKLNSHHIAWLGHIPPYHLIHQKTLILDHRKAIVMTFNFTHTTFKNERNFALVLDEPEKVRHIASLFSADWNHVPTHNPVSELIVSPDDSRNKLIAHIKQAKKTMQIYAQNINDYKIVGALAKAAKQGVSVQILTSAKMRKKQEQYLTRAGVKIHYSEAFIIHAKVFNIDDELAIIGSINLTRASLDDNREMSVLTRDPIVIKQLHTTFNQDWNAAGQANSYPHLQKILSNQRMLSRTLRRIQKFVNNL